MQSCELLTHAPRWPLPVRQLVLGCGDRRTACPGSLAHGAADILDPFVDLRERCVSDPYVIVVEPESPWSRLQVGLPLAELGQRPGFVALFPMLIDIAQQPENLVFANAGQPIRWEPEQTLPQLCEACKRKYRSAPTFQS